MVKKSPLSLFASLSIVPYRVTLLLMSKVKPISVWIGHHDTHVRRMLHCPLCGNPLIQINGNVAQMMVGDAQKETNSKGLTIRCKKRLRDMNGFNYKCSTEVTIIDAISTG